MWEEIPIEKARLLRACNWLLKLREQDGKAMEHFLKFSLNALNPRSPDEPVTADRPDTVFGRQSAPHVAWP